jgi:hypothetical protein
MRPSRLLPVLVITLFLVAGTAASGPAHIYAVIDNVVLEPNDKAPERIQVWGIFAVWNASVSAYDDPARGYMYFRLPEPQDVQWRAGGNRPSAPIALAEWSDLKRVAGSTSGVAFGERGQWQGRLRPATEKPATPDRYPIYNGITQLSMMDSGGPHIIARLQEAARRR